MLVYSDHPGTENYKCYYLEKINFLANCKQEGRKRDIKTYVDDNDDNY